MMLSTDAGVPLWRAGTGTAGTIRSRRLSGAGGALVLTKPDRLAPPYPMLENINEVMTGLSQEFPLPTGKP